MKTKLFIIVAIFLLPVLLFAQEVSSDTAKISQKVIVGTDKPKDSTKVFEWKPSTSLYFELLGKGFYSINVDFRKTKSMAWSIGMSVAEDGFFPSLMYYHFAGKRFRFEMGGGLSTVFTQTDGLAGMGIHGVVGYRYQKKKGLLFRIGFTPFLGIPFTETGKTMFVPLIGISLGYSF